MCSNYFVGKDAVIETKCSTILYLVVKTYITKINVVLYLEKDLYFVGVVSEGLQFVGEVVGREFSEIGQKVETMCE